MGGGSLNPHNRSDAASREEQCRAAVGPPERLQLADGQPVYVDPHAISAGPAGVLIVGYPTLIGDGVRSLDGAMIDHRHAVGAIIDKNGVARLTPAPPGDTALNAPMVSYDQAGKWDVVWEHDGVSRRSEGDSSLLLHARFDGVSWGPLERITKLLDPELKPGVTSSSSIARGPNGLIFALPQLDSRTGGVVRVVSQRDGTWPVQVVSTGTAGSAYTAISNTGGAVALAYVTGGNALAVRRSFDNGRTWSEALPIVRGGAYAPSLVRAMGNQLLLVWQQELREKDGVFKEAWLTQGTLHDNTWTPPRPITATRAPVVDIATTVVSDLGAVVLVQAGTARRREQRLLAFQAGDPVELYHDSVDAATRPLIAAVSRNELEIYWGAASPVYGGFAPHAWIRRVELQCENKRSR